MTLVTHPCLDRCGRLVTGNGRCKACRVKRDQERNRKPERVALYGGTWPAESRTIRANHPWCVRCGQVRGLTVDHPTRQVLCFSCHGKLEAERRAAFS